MRHSLRSVLPVTIALALPLVSLACGGRVDIDVPDAGPIPTTTPTPTTTGTVAPPSTSTPPFPGDPPVPPPSPTTPPVPQPECNPADCALPNTDAATCRGGVCAPAVCTSGFADCDGNPSNGCELAVGGLFPDTDGDGFGDGTKPLMTCPVAGVDYVKNGDDCYDQNYYARPGQTGFFVPDRGDGSFDYDCDGQEQLRASATHDEVCICSDFGCSIDEGWIGPVPTCAATGTWGRAPGGFSCTAIPERRAQACR